MNKKLIKLFLITASLWSVPAHANDIEPGKEVFAANKRTTPIVLDGDLSEWAVTNIIADPRFLSPKLPTLLSRSYVSFETRNSAYTWNGATDQTSSVRVVWDANAIYIGIDVTDDTHENTAPPEAAFYDGDSVQLMVTNSTRTLRTILFNCALSGTDGNLSTTGTFNESYEAGDLNGLTKVFIKRNSETKQTIYEIKIPKEALNLVTLDTNTKFGLGMAINDGDTQPGQGKQGGWGGLGAHAIVGAHPEPYPATTKSPLETALVSLQLTGPTPRCYVSAVSTPLGPRANTFTFRSNDVAGSLVNPATTTLKIDGQPVVLTASAKVGGKIDFAYNLPTLFLPDSEHNYTIELGDTGGNTITSTSTFKLAASLLPFQVNLPTPPIAPGLWATRYILKAGSIPLLSDAILMVKASILPGFVGSMVDATSSVINHGPFGIFGNLIPYAPAAEAIDGTLEGKPFIMLSAAQISIPTAGKYTFGVRTDEGFAMRIRRAEAISTSSESLLDAGDLETVYRGNGSTSLKGDPGVRTIYEFATPGEYRIEFLYYNSEQGTGSEIYAVKGEFTQDSETPFWQLVGNVSPAGSYDALGVTAPGWTVVSSKPGVDAMEVKDKVLESFADADNDLGLFTSAPVVYSRLEVGDPNTDPHPDTPNSTLLPFPLNTSGDDDDFALRATAQLVVPRTGLYRIQFNTSDGGYVKITGGTFSSIIESYKNKAVIDPTDRVIYDAVVPEDTNTTAEISLLAGTYAIEAGMFERADEAFLIVRGSSAETPGGAIGTSIRPTLAAGGAATINYAAAGIALATNTISSVAVTGGNVVISFTPTFANENYKIASSPDLLTWTTLTTIPALNAGAVTFTVPTSGTRSFYRIVK